MRYMFFGAHPDDADLMMGGTSLKLIKNGHHVKFVSVSNGDCGHQSMERKALAARRYEETQKSAALAGLDAYEVMDIPDCGIEVTLENREKIIRMIRAYQPDVVITHRNCDYHADHRATAQLIQDAAYLLMVPLYCPDTPIPEVNPVFAYAYDRFTKPAPVQPDAVVEIDSVIEEKFHVLDCHVSQFYEWLPFTKGMKDFSVEGWTWEQKRAHLDEHWGIRFKTIAEYAAEQLEKRYHHPVKYAELFEYSPYGRAVTPEEFQELFPY